MWHSRKYQYNEGYTKQELAARFAAAVEQSKRTVYAVPWEHSGWGHRPLNVPAAIIPKQNAAQPVGPQTDSHFYDRRTNTLKTYSRHATLVEPRPPQQAPPKQSNRVKPKAANLLISDKVGKFVPSKQPPVPEPFLKDSTFTLGYARNNSKYYKSLNNDSYDTENITTHVVVTPDKRLDKPPYGRGRIKDMLWVTR